MTLPLRRRQPRPMPPKLLHLRLDDRHAPVSVRGHDPGLAEQVARDVEGDAARRSDREIVGGEAGEGTGVGGVGGLDAVGHEGEVSE